MLGGQAPFVKKKVNMQHKRHNVVLQKPDGGLEMYPMKQWLRDHPKFLPEGMDTYEKILLAKSVRFQLYL